MLTHRGGPFSPIVVVLPKHGEHVAQGTTCFGIESLFPRQVEPGCQVALLPQLQKAADQQGSIGQGDGRLNHVIAQGDGQKSPQGRHGGIQVMLAAGTGDHLPAIGPIEGGQVKPYRRLSRGEQPGDQGGIGLPQGAGGQGGQPLLESPRGLLDMIPAWAGEAHGHHQRSLAGGVVAVVAQVQRTHALGRPKGE